MYAISKNYSIQIFIIFAIIATSFACFDTSKPFPVQPTESPFNFSTSSKGLRIINLSYNSPEIDFLFSSKSFLSKSVFRNASSSMDIGTITGKLQIKESKSSIITKEIPITGVMNKLTYAILWDKYESKLITTVTSDPQTSSKKKSLIRFFHGSKSLSPKLDIKVKNASSSYSVDGLGVGEMSQYFEVESGQNTIFLYPNLTNFISLATNSNLELGKVYTAFIGGSGNSIDSQKLDIYFISETNYSAQNLFSFPEIKCDYRVINCCSAFSNADILVDNISGFSSVPYKRTTALSKIKAGSRNFKILNSGSSSVKYDGTYSFNPDKKYDVILLGNASNIEILLYEGQSQTPSSDKSFLRIINTNPNMPKLNVILKGSDNYKYNQSLNYKSVTNYLSFPSGSIEITFLKSNLKDTLKTGYAFLSGGKTYSAFINSTTGTDFTVDFMEDSNENSQDLFGSF